jgi:hypothetical protein
MSMHEWILTRNDVRGTPFEWKMQIYVPWNCVLVHEGHCHLEAQSNPKMMIVQLRHIRMYYKRDVIENWLRDISPHVSRAREKLRWIQEQFV